MDGKVSTHVYLKNSGKTPAMHIKVSGSILFRTSVDEWFKHPEDPGLSEGLLLQNNGELSTIVFSDEALPKTNAGYMLVAHVKYKDIFKKTYWSDVCWWKVDPKADLMHCPWHNEIH